MREWSLGGGDGVVSRLLATTTIVVWGLWTSGVRAEENFFAGVLGGISTLSADGRSVTRGESIATSLYKPENGPTVMAVFGGHVSEYVSVQGSYGWNRNDLSLVSANPAEGPNAFYEQARQATQHTAVAELMVYFRNRRSRVRPYLSAGGGVVRFDSPASTIDLVAGSDQLAPGAFQSNGPAIRVAVGVDVFIKNGWAFRFTFAETIRSNPISAQLSPPGQRGMANFQNLFGLVKQF